MTLPRSSVLALVTSAAFVLAAAATASAQTTAFTYQGRLDESANPAAGSYDFQFKLFDTVVVGTGTQQGSTLTRTAVTVTRGLFTVSLDFGVAPFAGPDRFLEIAVKKPSDSTFTILGPRQALTSEPYAIRSRGAAAADSLSAACVNCVGSGQILDVQGAQVTGPIAGSQISGPIPVASVPAGSGFYIQNGTSPQASASFNVAGSGVAAVFDAATQFNLGGQRLISNAGADNLFVGLGTAIPVPDANNFGNAIFGKNAGAANQSRYNAFFGLSAGGSTTTGCCNSMLGNFAGYGNTTGRSNVFIGGSTAFQNTSGSFNVYIGDLSGYDFTTGLTTGNFNTALGYSSGRLVTTGSFNTLIGYNTVGAANLDHATVIGADAVVTTNSTIMLGRPQDTVRAPGALVVAGTASAADYAIAGARVLSVAGTGNLFAGAGAGSLNTGTANAFLGSNAGQNNATANENTFVGNSAGQNSGTGDTTSAASFNTFVGSGAGITNVSGASNTALGAHADVHSGLDHATAIGADAVATLSNTIVLGRDADQVVVPGTALSVFGTIAFGQLGTAGGVQLCRNTIRNQLASCSSSLRYKTDLSPYTHGMDLVARLRPINFRWKEDGTADVGLGAEDVAAVEPLLITHNDKGQIEGVKYDHLAVLFVNALKEQQAQLDAQKEEIRQQAAEIEALKALLRR